MHILALAVDYDGTIAENGFVSQETLSALARLKESRRKLLLVTGRQLVDLQHACRDLDIFDYVIAENGAVLHVPKSNKTHALAPPPPRHLVERLSQQGSMPISVGQTIIATWHPHEHAVVNAIRDLGLEHQIIFNKDAVMVLPANVNKATGLRAALKELDIAPVCVAGCGDAENDHSFLQICGCSAAVSNALPSLTEAVDIVLKADHGRGVIEFIDRILQEDDHILPLWRRAIEAGSDQNGDVCYIRPEDVVLLVGNSGCGKSSYLTLLTERMTAKGHEFLVIDPEGDYLALQNAATIGGLDTPPSTEDTLRLLLQADINVVVNTMALEHDGKKRLFAKLMPSIRKLRETSGRPQWLVIDEAHYILPFPGKHKSNTSLSESGAIVATVNPASIGMTILKEIDTVIAMGATATLLITETANLLGLPPPQNLPHLGSGEFIVWPIKADMTGASMKVLRQERPEQSHNRHSGKYALGDVGQQRSFYFQGIEQYAHNLRDFLDLASLVDDEAWKRHLLAHDFSAWFRNVIRDDTLANDALKVEHNQKLAPAESRNCISSIVSDRYVLEK